MCIRDSPEGYDFEQWKPYIVQHKRMKMHLWCMLTNKTIERSVRAVTNHTSSARFARLKEAALVQEEGDEQDPDDFVAKLEQFESELAEQDQAKQAAGVSDGKQLDDGELALCERERPTASSSSFAEKAAVRECQFGRKCHRPDCAFVHSKGRVVDEEPVEATDKKLKQPVHKAQKAKTTVKTSVKRKQAAPPEAEPKPKAKPQKRQRTT
eukprot:TRINITY_DN20147_c0_g1_i2.p1 TRINITY_DN20147_c0_g1~~TRINITY_DN20147_c0_g1_i2.p1  ORF type:complete len:210 (+),score=59.46 TRINITY_DN20147_c0_g1_i2:130-759(+)